MLKAWLLFDAFSKPCKYVSFAGAACESIPSLAITSRTRRGYGLVSRNPRRPSRSQEEILDRDLFAVIRLVCHQHPCNEFRRRASKFYYVPTQQAFGALARQRTQRYRVACGQNGLCKSWSHIYSRIQSLLSRTSLNSSLTGTDRTVSSRRQGSTRLRALPVSSLARVRVPFTATHSFLHTLIYKLQ